MAENSGIEVVNIRNCARSREVSGLGIIYLTKQPSESIAVLGYEPDELVVTPAMVEAGVLEFRERCFGERMDEIVTDVFVAMLSAR